MSDLVKLAEVEVMRREVLELCYASAPLGCSKQVLEVSIRKMGIDTADLDKQLYYMVEKSLLKVEHAGNPRLGIHRDVYSITAVGMDYLDGNGAEIPGMGG
ncbi:MAG: hypothetical protein J6K53_02765 [Roseburia sp.]|nr:hypothetical protein [Roseburia sp.]